MMIPARDLRAAFLAVWLIVSSVLFATAVSPWIFSEDKLHRVFPPCEARLRGNPCALCGMTTAYLRIGAGDFTGAQEANAGSVWLWSVSILNFVFAKSYFLLALIRQRRIGGS